MINQSIMTIILLLKEHKFYTKRFHCFLNWRPRALKGHARATRQKGEKEGRKGGNGEKGRRMGEGKRKGKRKKKGYSLLTSFVRSSEKSLPWPQWRTVGQRIGGASSGKVTNARERSDRAGGGSGSFFSSILRSKSSDLVHAVMRFLTLYLIRIWIKIITYSITYTETGSA